MFLMCLSVFVCALTSLSRYYFLSAVPASTGLAHTQPPPSHYLHSFSRINKIILLININVLLSKLKTSPRGAGTQGSKSRGVMMVMLEVEKESETRGGAELHPISKYRTLFLLGLMLRLTRGGVITSCLFWILELSSHLPSILPSLESHFKHNVFFGSLSWKSSLVSVC